MPRKGYKPEQILGLLRQVEVAVDQGRAVSLACREASISHVSYYRWRKEYGGLQIDQVKRMTALEKENSRLKRLVADLSLDKAMLQEIASINF